jgi:hypothetical protein
MNKYPTQTGFRIDPKLRDEFRKVAEANGRSLAGHLRYLMSEEVRKHKEEQK